MAIIITYITILSWTVIGKFVKIKQKPVPITHFFNYSTLWKEHLNPFIQYHWRKSNVYNNQYFLLIYFSWIKSLFSLSLSLLQPFCFISFSINLTAQLYTPKHNKIYIKLVMKRFLLLLVHLFHSDLDLYINHYFIMEWMRMNQCKSYKIL